MAKQKTPLHQPIKNPWILVAIALAIIITFVSLYVNKGPGAGQAVSIGETAWDGGTVNLEQEGTITLTTLPSTRREINFTIANRATDTTYNEYNFTLLRLDAQSYQFILSKYPETAGQQQPEIARDILSVGGAEDRSLIYVDQTDGIPELEVISQNNQVIIRNYHFIPPTRAIIKLQNVTTDPAVQPPRTQVLPQVIRLPKGETFNAYINASSIVTPSEITAFVNSSGELGTLTLGSLVPSVPDYLNYTTRTLTYIAPNEDVAVLLDINATVLGRITHAYYTIAVGDKAYALLEDHFPRMQFTLDPVNASNSQLIIILQPTLELQPLALPCDVTEPFSTLFAGKIVRQVFTYGNGAAQVWTNKTPANDITSFEPFRGYFVQLSEAGSTSTILTTRCTINSTEPLFNAPPSFTIAAQTPVQLTAGWNLFAMRGIVPRALTEFTTDTSFKVFECRQNYVCSEVPRNTQLNPGKPYWIYTVNPLTINYWLR